MKKTIKKKPATKKKILKKKSSSPKLQWSKKVFDQEKFQILFDKGKQRGFVTTSEILYSFPEIEKDIKGLENLFKHCYKTMS